MIASTRNTAQCKKEESPKDARVVDANRVHVQLTQRHDTDASGLSLLLASNDRGGGSKTVSIHAYIYVHFNREVACSEKGSVRCCPPSLMQTNGRAKTSKVHHCPPAL